MLSKTRLGMNAEVLFNFKCVFVEFARIQLSKAKRVAWPEGRRATQHGGGKGQGQPLQPDVNDSRLGDVWLFGTQFY